MQLNRMGINQLVHSSNLPLAQTQIAQTQKEWRELSQQKVDQKSTEIFSQQANPPSSGSSFSISNLDNKVESESEYGVEESFSEKDRVIRKKWTIDEDVAIIQGIQHQFKGKEKISSIRWKKILKNPVLKKNKAGSCSSHLRSKLIKIFNFFDQKDFLKMMRDPSRDDFTKAEFIELQDKYNSKIQDDVGRTIHKTQSCYKKNIPIRHKESKFVKSYRENVGQSQQRSFLHRWTLVEVKDLKKIVEEKQKLNLPDPSLWKEVVVSMQKLKKDYPVRSASAYYQKYNKQASDELN